MVVYTLYKHLRCLKKDRKKVDTYFVSGEYFDEEQILTGFKARDEIEV